jgi:hypothetical protein
MPYYIIPFFIGHLPLSGNAHRSDTAAKELHKVRRQIYYLLVPAPGAHCEKYFWETSNMA